MMISLWLVPALPFIAAAIILAAPKSLSRMFGLIATSSAAISMAVMIQQFIVVTHGGFPSTAFYILEIGRRKANIGLSLDPLGAIVGLLVATVATLVLAYSIGYMRGEPSLRRFFAVMSVFTGAMLTLVLAGDYLLLYAAWEIVGFCSYLLIGHHSQEPKAASAAGKAFLITRIGDLGLLLGIGLLLINFGSTTYGTIFRSIQSNSMASPALAPIAFLILAGALGKSAQFPLHFWLPDAMAGPTPVSALIHSATMVAAGIYLVARSFPIFQAVPSALATLLVLASITAVSAALAACVQTDIKRVLAYSTMSQLGEMGISLGIGSMLPAIFHLISQASFKALLFLSAGLMTKAAGTNEIFRLGKPSRTASIGFFLGALSLSGIPPFSGFWSKAAMSAHEHDWTGVLGSVLTILSAFYISRVFFIALTVKSELAAKQSLDALSVRVPIYLLALLTLIVGFIQSPIADGWLGKFLGAPEPLRLDANVVAQVGLAILGWFVAFALYKWRAVDLLALRKQAAALHRVVFGGFGTDKLPVGMAHLGVAISRGIGVLDDAVFDRAANGISGVALWVANGFSLFDRTVFDRAANGVPNAMLRAAKDSNWLDVHAVDRTIERAATAIRDLGGRLRQLQTGRIYHYLAVVALWVLITAFITLTIRW